jgi:hypothetical protein
LAEAGADVLVTASFEATNRTWQTIVDLKHNYIVNQNPF